jgi:hypothetical protein
MSDKMDARAFIAGVDRETLETQIADAKVSADKATGEYRSLISLRRLIDFRDGVAKRRFTKKPKAQAAEDDSPDAEAGDDDDPMLADESLADSIEGILGRALGPMSELSIAKNVTEKLPKVKAVLRAFADRFEQAGPGTWKLAGEED